MSTHPKTARREEKSGKKKEERVGAQLIAEIMGPATDTAAFAISDPIWRPSSLHPHVQPTWASQPRNAPSQLYRHDTEQRAEHAQRPEATAPPAAEDSKRALVRELQKDLSRMSLLLERLDELLSA